MKHEEIHAIVEAQRAWFHTGATLDVNYRLDALRRLKAEIIKNEAHIAQAIQADLGKSAF